MVTTMVLTVSRRCLEPRVTGSSEQQSRAAPVRGGGGEGAGLADGPGDSGSSLLCIWPGQVLLEAIPFCGLFLPSL